MSNSPSKLRTVFAIAAIVGIDTVGLIAAVAGTTCTPLGLVAGVTTFCAADALAGKAYNKITCG